MAVPRAGFQDPDQFYAVYNQLMGSRPKLVLSAHLFYSLPLEDTVYKSVYGQVPGLSDIIERGKAEMLMAGISYQKRPTIGIWNFFRTAKKPLRNTPPP